MNPTAIVFWLLCASIAYLAGGETLTSAVWGLVFGLSVSLLAAALPDRKR